ncbi:MAG: IclR family transcriptional regulator [bacterium]
MKTIQSIQRAINILSLFSLNEPSLGISEMSRMLHLNKGTVQGIIRTLLEEGFLQQNTETRKYQLGIRLYELGTTAAGSLEINQRASNPAHDLAKRTGYLVRIAIFDKDSAFVTLDAYPRSEPFLFRQIGPRTPLYSTALGKAILAFLDQSEFDAYLQRTELISYTTQTITRKDELLRELSETRRRGYSINREEHIFGRAAVGAPIFGRQRRLCASACIVDNPDKILGKDMENLAREVKQTALEISMNMGYFP